MNRQSIIELWAGINASANTMYNKMSNIENLKRNTEYVEEFPGVIKWEVTTDARLALMAAQAGIPVKSVMKGERSGHMQTIIGGTSLEDSAVQAGVLYGYGEPVQQGDNVIYIMYFGVSKNRHL